MSRNKQRAVQLTLFTLPLLTLTTPAHASIFKGEALDTVANFLSWVVLFVVPVVGISVFWLLHIMPEKIAEKKHHPQAKAIHVLCLLSLFFGGLLWPLAWLWAYSKPVLYKMAYGTDVADDSGHGKEAVDLRARELETEQLRAKVAKLEKKLAGIAANLGGDA